MRTLLPEKLYYNIGEVADALNVKPSLIRFWESEFEELNPKKNTRGTRKFTIKDIDKIEIILFLVKERGYTLEGAKQQLKKSTKNTVDLVQRLKKIKSELLRIREEL